jgi:hypothetical protein
MAVAVVYRMPAMSAAQYRQSWTAGPPVDPPAGLIFHAGIGEDAAFFTVTVWESRAAYDAFAPLFAQAMRTLGFEFGTPEILPVHHFLPPVGSSSSAAQSTS